MTRRFAGGRLVLATHNRGKLAEITTLLAPFPVEVVSAADLGLPEPEETEETFAGNARIKAHAAAKASDLPALADDSGIEVDALDGAPGVHTAGTVAALRVAREPPEISASSYPGRLGARRSRTRAAAAAASAPQAANRRARGAKVATLAAGWPDAWILLLRSAISASPTRS